MSPVASRLWTWRGLLTNSLTFGSILTSAEYTQRKINKKAADWPSLSRYAIVGSGVIAPFFYTYYCILDSKLPGTAARTVALKVASDVIFANVGYYCLFYYCLSYLEHQSHPKAKNDVNSAFKISYLAGMAYWCPMMTINFKYLSPKWRVLFVGFATYIEMNGLCMMRRWL